MKGFNECCADVGDAEAESRLEIESGGVWVRVPNQNCLSVCTYYIYLLFSRVRLLGVS